MISVYLLLDCATILHQAKAVYYSITKTKNIWRFACRNERKILILQAANKVTGGVSPNV